MQNIPVENPVTAHRLADKANKHLVYQQILQSPEADVELLQTIYHATTGLHARHLREDFCGTGYTLAHWVSLGEEHRGEGYDIDPDPIEWGWHNNFLTRPHATSRATLRVEDARARSLRPPEIRCAFNFSYWVFTGYDELLGYFRTAWEDLPDHGMFIIDVTGGTEGLTEDPYESDAGEVTCIWQQQNFSPVDHTAELTLRFRFSDGSELDPPYRYRWRVWSIPELRGLLQEAGFSRTEVWWQNDELDGIGYAVTEKGQNSPCWVACISALK